MSIELKPCPWCGGEAENWGASEPWSPGGQHTNGPNRRRVGCKKCLVFFAEEDAPPGSGPRKSLWPIAAWNTRPGEEAAMREAFEAGFERGFNFAVDKENLETFDEWRARK